MHSADELWRRKILRYCMFTFMIKIVASQCIARLLIIV